MAGSLLPASMYLSMPREGKIVHAGQRVWMLRVKHPLARPYHLHVQLFVLVPSTFEQG
jgi:hypothetical protein